MRLNDHDHQILVRMPGKDVTGDYMLTLFFEKSFPEVLLLVRETINNGQKTESLLSLHTQEALGVVSGITAWLSFLMSAEEQKQNADDGH